MSQDAVMLGEVIATWWLVLGGLGLAWYRDARQDRRVWSLWTLAGAITLGPILLLGMAGALAWRWWRPAIRTLTGASITTTKASLSPQDREIVRLRCQGYSLRAIGQQLQLEPCVVAHVVADLLQRAYPQVYRRVR